LIGAGEITSSKHLKRFIVVTLWCLQILITIWCSSI
jgi:hypothetical protein